MSMYSHRLQILLDDARYERVSAAARALLEAPDMPVPEVGELRAELDRLRGRRAGPEAA